MNTSKTILVVDDDFDIRETLKDILEDEGFEAQGAADGIEALEYLKSKPPPGLILLDWMMPRCNGAEFRHRQRSDPDLADIPVVLLTADMRLEEKTKALDADGYLNKPLELDKLLEVVEKHCGEASP
jgi:CheY-like chemotaxis protein